MQRNFSINRIVFPHLSLPDFFKTLSELGITGAELRNDLPGLGVVDSFSAKEVKKMADDNGVSILTINALQKFNLPEKFLEAKETVKVLLDLSKELGCEGLVMCPNNEMSDTRTATEFLQHTAEGLSLYAPLFKDAQITGYVEPLGFGECSLRSKADALSCITKSGTLDVYGLVHDTFHHFLGTDVKISSQSVRLVHISGVEDKTVAADSYRDPHRVLVGTGDLIDNKGQMLALDAAGFKGYYSFEPFSAEVQNTALSSLKTALQQSMEYLNK
ncbi:MAG: TIM barrel protein [Brevinema sp.]